MFQHHLQYNNGIPPNSRFATEATFKETADELKEAEGLEKIRKVKELTSIAEGMLSIISNPAR